MPKSIAGGFDWCCALAISLWFSLPTAVSTLVMLVVIDYATGLLAAKMRKEVSSRIGWYGAGRKVMTFLLLWALSVASKPLGAPWAAPGMALIFCVNEMISIKENCEKVGVTLPAPIRKWLERTEEDATQLGRLDK